MKITATSDLHGNLPKVGWGDLDIAPSDVLCIAGDITFLGRNDYLGQAHFINRRFNKWIDSICKYYNKIFLVAGNHDTVFENCPEMINLSKNVILLNDKPFVYNNVTFYGTPWQSPFHNWGFNADDERRDLYFSQIPDNVDVLITHSPPNGLGKTLYGDDADDLILTKHIERSRPKFNFCGHIHECSGSSVNLHGCMCYNVSYVNFNYDKVGNSKLVEI